MSATAGAELRKRSFPPVWRGDARLLLLGSLPGEASLAAARYYAHPRNQFWRLMGEVIGRELEPLPYDERLLALLNARVALWDVVAEAERPGSLDAAIRGHQPNDLRALVGELPELRAIGFNGVTAAKIGTAALGAPERDVVLVRLPSSSPALPRAYEQKLTMWLGLRRYLN